MLPTIAGVAQTYQPSDIEYVLFERTVITSLAAQIVILGEPIEYLIDATEDNDISYTLSLWAYLQNIVHIVFNRNSLALGPMTL